MPHMNPLITANYYQFAQNLDPTAPLYYSLDKEEKENITIQPTCYSIEQNQELEQKENNNETRISTTSYTGKNGNFLRITNVASFVPETDAALVLGWQDYRLAQRLGITQQIDQTLTAKTIGLIGDYRFKVLKDQEQYIFRTDLFHQKEMICQHACDQLEALQKIECAFGRNYTEVKAAIKNYKNALQHLHDMSGKKIAEQAPNRIITRNYLALGDDIHALDKLEQEITRLEENNPDAPYHPIYGLELTKFPLEQFVRSQTNQIIDRAKFKNELITIANGDSLFRGVLEEQLGKAEKLCTRFHFHQNKLIKPEHQGDYSHRPAKKITLLSSHATGNSREHLRKFLLVSSYILHYDEKHDPFNESDKQFAIKKTRGWTRLFRKEKTDRRIFRTYDKLRQLAAKANISRLKIAAEDMWNLGDLIYRGVSKAIRGVLSTFGHEFYKIGADFIVTTPPAPDPLTEHLVQSEVAQSKNQKLQLNDNEFRFIIDENWQTWPERKKIVYIIETIVKAQQKTNIELTEPQKKFLAMLRSESLSAPLAMPPYQLNQTDPDDFLSSIVGGIEAFYSVFDEIYETNPCIALYCSLLYGLAGLAAIHPALITSLFEKIHLGALAKPFIAWNKGTAEMMTNGTISNFISAGFTAWQELLFASNALATADDSSASELCKYLSHHFPKVIGATLAAYGLGYLITKDQLADIPGIGDLGRYIKEDAGKQPYIEEFFAGVKLGLITHETFQSKPENQSIAATIISFLLQCALFPVRLFVTSPINLFLSLFNPARLHNVVQPWKDLYHATKSVLLRIVDAGLRVLNLAGRAMKCPIKTAAEWLMNTLTILSKLIIRPFVNPENNKMAAGIITFKINLFDLCGKITRGIKDVYRWCRNGIAREINRPVTQQLQPAMHRRRSSSANAFAALNIPPNGDMPDREDLTPDSFRTNETESPRNRN